jgi:WD40 repeat protein
MRALVLLVLVAPALAADPEPHVRARLGDDRFRQAGRVECLAYSPDGKWLASADVPNVIVWDAATGRQRATIELKRWATLGLSFSADGNTLLVVRVDNKGLHLVRLDPAAGTVLDDRYLGPGGEKVAFSPDVAWLAYRFGDGTKIQLFATATGNLAWAAALAGHRFNTFAFRPDNKAVAVGTLEGRLIVYDLASGKPLHDHPVRGGTIWTLAFSPDGKDLVAEVGGPDPNRIVRFDAGNGLKRWEYRTGRAKELAFTADGKAIRFEGVGARGHDPHRWYLLDATTALLGGPTLDPGPVYSVARHPNGRTVAFGDLDGLISQWDEPTAKRLKASADPPTGVHDLYFSADGKKVRGWARGWYEWDLATGKQVRQSPPILDPAGIDVAGSRDLRWLAVEKPVAGGFRIELHDKATGDSREIPETFRTGSSFRFLPTGRLLIEADDWWTAYDPDGGNPVRVPPPGKNQALAASPDGTGAVLFSVSTAGTRLDRYDLRTARRLGTWTGQVPDLKPIGPSLHWRAGLAPDASVLLLHHTYLLPQDLYLDDVFALDPATGRKLGAWTAPERDRHLLRPDGRSVLSWDRFPFVGRFREVATGEERAAVSCRRRVDECRFHPDGHRLAVSTGPHPVEIWDLLGDPGPWDPAAADALWAALADTKADTAFEAIRRLWAHPAEGVALLKKRVRVMPAIPDDWLAARLRGVDAKAFRDREQASADLAAVAELVADPLRAALPTASAEARVRIEAAIKVAGEMTPDRLRQIRACEVLEGIGTLEALAVLKTWAAGPAEATLTREAKASVGRLSKR